VYLVRLLVHLYQGKSYQRLYFPLPIVLSWIGQELRWAGILKLFRFVIDFDPQSFSFSNCYAQVIE